MPTLKKFRNGEQTPFLKKPKCSLTTTKRWLNLQIAQTMSQFHKTMLYARKWQEENHGKLDINKVTMR